MSFLKAIETKNGQIFEVGGTLRDTLLGIPHKDKDLLVTGIAMDELTRLLSQHGNVQKVGKSFGILKFHPKEGSSEFDIALPRVEKSTGTGHRDFEVEFDPFIPVEKDLGRRDFTMNAMARNLQTGEMMDPFQGQEDLANKTLRMVFKNTFREDPLRLLRAIQFAARLHLKIEKDTLAEMKQDSALIKTISPERIIEEIRKLLMAPQPSIGFWLMRETDILRHIFPEVQGMIGTLQPKKHGGDVFEHTMKVMDAARSHKDVESAGDLELIFSALFHDTGKPATAAFSEDKGDITFHGHQIISKRIWLKWMKRYKTSTLGIDGERVARLVDNHMFETKSYYSDRAIRRFINKIGPDLIYKQLDLRIADKKGGGYPESVKGVLKLKSKIKEELDKKPPFGPKDLAINGHDLMSLGFAEGPDLGKILKDLVELVLDHPEKNNREELISYLIRIKSSGDSR